MNKPNKKIRVGVVGVGNWGRYGHLPALQLLPDFEIIAVSSRRKEYAEQVANEVGIPRAFTDTNELINQPDIDLVVVLPPAPHHATLVRAAISAGKDVYCEWPLTTKIEDSEDLLAKAKAAGVRSIVGLQRRLGASARYVRDLLAEGYVGQIRSVRMHVSMNYFQARRSADLEWTIPVENFLHILSIYGGHFMDLLFHLVGAPKTVSAEVHNQFPEVTIIETEKTYTSTAPDQVLAIGELATGGVFTLQIEGGKRNNSGVQIDITGTEGDLKSSNPRPFTNFGDNKVEGAKGDNLPLELLPIPSRYQTLPPSKLDASVLDLAYLYAAYSNDRETGTHNAPDFSDAVRVHKLIDLISNSFETGIRKHVNFW